MSCSEMDALILLSLVMVWLDEATFPFHTAPGAFHTRLEFHVNGCGMEMACSGSRHILAIFFFGDDLRQVAEGAEGGQDGGDLIRALLVLAAKAGAEGLGIRAVGGEELAQDGDLGGQLGGPHLGFKFQVGSFKFGVLQRQRALA